MKRYKVEHQGLEYHVQLHPDTAENIGAELVVNDKAPSQKKKVSRGTRKNVSRETPSEPDTTGSEVETEE